MTRGREEFGRVYHAYGRRVTMLVPLWHRNGKIV
jgi:protein-S-isoprenylcysteine O-methyltransferase Ste14